MLTALSTTPSRPSTDAVSTPSAAPQPTATASSTSSDALTIVDSMQADIASVTIASRNINSSLATLQTADGSLANIDTLLQRAITLASEASTGNLTTEQLQALNTEFQALLSEINRLTITTTGDTTSTSTALQTSEPTAGATTSSSDETSSAAGTETGSAPITAQTTRSTLSPLSTSDSSPGEHSGTSSSASRLAEFNTLRHTAIAALSGSNQSSSDLLDLLRLFD